MKQAKDLTGMTFGELTVLCRAEDHVYKSGRRDIAYTCKCSCGNIVCILAVHLRSGHTSSCGCLRVETAKRSMTTHGATSAGRCDRLYDIWKNMKSRCYNKNNKNYHNYGGRGITICGDWADDFAAFRTWSLSHGYDDDLTIDRIDVNSGYCPDNCRWATQKEQCNNTRRTIMVKINDKTHSVKEWCEIMGIKYGTVISRIYRGMDPLDALNKK